MFRIAITIVTLWLIQLSAATINNHLIDLTPLPRDVWDHDHRMATRAEDYGSSVGLKTSEQFMWSSSNKTTDKQTVVSIVVYTRQDETIIDMDKFATLLESVSCTDQMVLKFRFTLAYLAAKISWNWVNFNNIRSFVLVTSWDGCGAKLNPEPWIVSNAVFDDAKRQVTLNAIKSTWKKVSNTAIIDFGDFVPGHIGGRDVVEKRAFDVSLDKAFTLDLTSNFPEEIANWGFSSPRVKANLQINCAECGTTGELVFAGHIEASLFGGLDKFEISAKPNGIAANLNLDIALQGEVDFVGLDPFIEEFTLVQLPLPSGWRIPGILTFGPNIQINAGFQVNYIGGSASLSTGISARIPDSSIAKVDLAAAKPVDISGWLPEITTQPLKIQAQIDTEVHVYTEIAVAVTLEVLDEDGVNVDIAIRVPDIKIVTSAGYNETGFCPSSVFPWGLTIDATLGASLYLEGYTEIKDDKDIFLNVPLFESPALYEFPQLCLSFEEESPGACVIVKEPGDLDYDKPETGPIKRKRSFVPSVRRRRDLVYSSLAERATDSSSKYYLTCDRMNTKAIFGQTYPRPADVKGESGNSVTTMLPNLACGATTCPSDQWKITNYEGEAAAVSHINFNTEHIYEKAWIVKFLNKIQADYFKDDCIGAFNYVSASGQMIDTPNKLISNDGEYHVYVYGW